MAESSKIEWTHATWNPITGCSVVSPGCTKCYAMRLAGGRLRHTRKYEFLTQPSKAGPVWTGEVRFDEATLTVPLRWREPRRIFVCSMSDLFHEDVPDEWIDRIFAVMALAPQHTFQVLTKRPERMRDYVSQNREGREISERLAELYVSHPQIATRWPLTAERAIAAAHWPLPNVWVGTSVEDQKRADERIPHLLNTPAAVRFLSCEPLLGPIDLTAIKRTKTEGYMRPLDGRFRTLDWIIVGGESGPRARLCNLAWMRDIIKQCHAASVPVFIKQLGPRPREICTSPKQFPVNLETIGVWVNGMSETRQAKVLSRDGHRYTVEWPLRDPKGGDMAEWPTDLRIREYPDG